MKDSPCYGIDLGTSRSAIACVEGGAPRLIPVDETGEVLLPSAVAFLADGEVLVGRAALNNLQADPERTILSSKRCMGTDHVHDLGGGRRVTPVEVAARVLGRLVEAAEAHTGARPRRAVITTPAWFTQAQRADTRRAGELAGLEVARVINEPTAAALAHAHDVDARRRVLVYDLGGGTFDVSLVAQDGPVVEVLASHGDSELGGDDVDVLLRDFVLRRLDATDRALVDAIAASPGAMLRLRVALEQAKITLGVEPSAALSLPFLVQIDGVPRHLDLTLTRDDLDRVVTLVLDRAEHCVDRVFELSGLGPSDVDELIFVGGSTHLPQVWHRMHARYGLEGSHAVAPEHAVALGAAIQAAIIDGVETRGVLVDVAPFPLSVAFAEPRQTTGCMHVISQVVTPRYAPLPSRHTEVFYTAGPEQRALSIPIFQGADDDPRRNVFLGLVRIADLEPAPEGTSARPLTVEMRHDLDGLVHVRVIDQLSGRVESVVLAADGAEQVQQRDAWLARLERQDNVIFGQGEAARRDGEADEGGAPALERQALGALFASLLEASAQLAAEHPDAHEALLDAARRGAAALEAGDLDAARQARGALEDLMFEHGVYL